jgi:hypothetical protein
VASLVITVGPAVIGHDRGYAITYLILIVVSAGAGGLSAVA